MRWYRYRSTLIVFAVLLVGVFVFNLPGRRPAEAADPTAPPKPAGKSASQPATGANDKELRQAVNDYVSALGKCDSGAVMAFWAPDAEYIAETGKVTRGKEAIAGLFKQCLPELKGHKVSGEVKSVRLLHPDVAMEEGTIDYVDADGTRDRNPYSAIWVKTDGKWLISSARDLPAEAPAGPSLAYAHLRPLEWLVGEWTEEGKKPAVEFMCKWGPNKAFLLIDLEVRREGQDPIHVTQRVGWDPRNETVRSWVFDSHGGFSEGTWARSGHRWSVESAGVLPDGGTASSNNSWESADGKTLVWRATDRLVDDQPINDVQVKFVRKGESKTGDPKPEAKP
jgi:uncharacterized protein (TIGR02246 family)